MLIRLIFLTILPSLKLNSSLYNEMIMDPKKNTQYLQDLANTYSMELSIQLY